MKKDEDKLLFKQIKKGNKQAFDTLFRKYYEGLVKFGMGYVHDGQTSEEIVQDCFIKLWENARRIEIETSVKAYIYRSVRNTSLNYIAHKEVERKYEQEQMHKATLEDTPKTELANIPLFNIVLSKAIGELPEKCRNVFEMSKFEGLTYDEISDYLQVSVKTVENQMGIALRKLREKMAPFKEKIYNY